MFKISNNNTFKKNYKNKSEKKVSDKLEVLYEDNQIIVVIKPQNLLSQSDQTGDDDMLSRVKNYVKEKYNKPGDVYIGLVHRLDRPTGGIMVFARNSKSASRLSKQIQDRTFEKKYLAVVLNKVKAKFGELEDYLKKDVNTNLVKITPRSEQGTKLAILNYNFLKEENDLSLLEIEIKTGRSHQIRVQLSNMKNPIYGDFKYGDTINKRTEGLALWAYKLEFTHPTKQEKMKFVSFPPENQLPWNNFKLEMFI